MGARGRAVSGWVVAVLVVTAVLVHRPPRMRLRRPAAPFRGGPAPGPEPTAALLLDLCAAGLSAGTPPAVALQVAGQAAGGVLGRRCDVVGTSLLLGADHATAWRGAEVELDPVRRALRLVAEVGVPGAGLLRRAAADERVADRLEAEARAQALGVRMVLPLGLCALPAFVAWGVVPVVLALASEVL